MSKKITKSKFKYVQPGDNIADVINNYPESVEIFLAYGLHCVGCFANAFDTIEAGAEIHGMGQEELTAMVKEVNYFISQNKKVEDLSS